MSRSEGLHIRISPEALEKVKRAAKASGRTLSDWSARAVEAMADVELSSKGVQPAPKRAR